MTREFVSFIVAGGIAAGVNWGSNILLRLVMPLEASVLVAYLIGMTTAYTLSRLFVFAESGRQLHDEYIRFAIVNVIAAAQVWLVTIALAKWFLPLIGWIWYPELVAHAAGVASPILTSYLGHKYFTFSKKDAKPSAESPE
ncbi:GtrA family protein [Maricaulis sp.]|uniref:GtrA family protein n=1 Tax=Maricaulis sp. TaxID=1486257 RepID=UPI0025BBAB9E|nr:GtrA family protein [Maricaulis sp.]